MSDTVTRIVDDKGRLTLGKGFAKRHVFVKRLPGGSLEITPAEIVPAREAWLDKNPKAIMSVMRGLEQAKRGEFAEPPDLEADAGFADMLED